MNASAERAAEHKILVVGDSISAAFGLDINRGWVQLLADRLTELEHPSEVINASVSGNTTGDGLSRLPKLLETHAPDTVIIELGGNDGLRGYPLKGMRQNLTTMIDLARDSGAQVLIVGIEIPPNYGQRYTSEFRESFQRVATEKDVKLVPFILEDIALQAALMQDDGIHPTEEAQPVMLENVWVVLKTMI
jgi:acyl-CoA thioesterase-1